MVAAPFIYFLAFGLAFGFGLTFATFGIICGLRFFALRYDISSPR